MPELASPVLALREALAHPLGQPALALKARGKDDALIILADHTRNYSYQLWLSELIDQLNRAGLPDERISLYVASGTHRPMTPEEREARFGAGLCRRLKFLEHDAGNEERMEKVGRTDYGTTLYVDRRVYQSDFLIITGGIQYHYFAGYSGGRKAILPGVSGRSSILHNHSLAFDRRTGAFGETVKPGVVFNNPVSEDMHEACMLIRPDFCVNVVLNAEKQVGWIGAGDYGYVHRVGAAFLDSYNRLALDRQFDVVVVGAGGYPKDISLFQAHKSLRHAYAAARPGAHIVWLAGCEEGEGPPAMKEFRPLDIDGARRKLVQQFDMGALCSFSLKLLAREFTIHMVTRLDHALVREWGLIPHATLDEALSALPARADKLSWAVGPDMSNVLAEQRAAGEPAAEPVAAGTKEAKP